jgi:hypothetical protein
VAGTLTIALPDGRHVVVAHEGTAGEIAARLVGQHGLAPVSLDGRLMAWGRLSRGGRRLAAGRKVAPGSSELSLVLVDNVTAPATVEVDGDQVKIKVDVGLATPVGSLVQGLAAHLGLAPGRHTLRVGQKKLPDYAILADLGAPKAELLLTLVPVS